MPLLPIILGFGVFGTGYFLGVKTSEVLKLVVVGGVVYVIIKKVK